MDKVVVKQVRSHIGRNKRVIGTLKAIGLGGIGKQKEIKINESIKGMLKTVEHLIEISPVK
jgi:large subunit ribosomal protein L30